VLVRLCSVCGVQIPQFPHTRGPCPECKRERERKRGKTRARGYDAEHKRLSKLAIAAHPFCVDCGATEDLVGDHIVPHSKGGLNVLSNYEVRCRSCNTARGNRESVFLRGQGRDPTPALREKHCAGVPSLQKIVRELADEHEAPNRAANRTVLGRNLSRVRFPPPPLFPANQIAIERQPDGMLDDKSRYAEKARKRAFSPASSGLAGTVTPWPSSLRR
jgi:5-methylcytosine-specific restriction protein A